MRILVANGGFSKQGTEKMDKNGWRFLKIGTPILDDSGTCGLWFVQEVGR